MSIFSKLNPMNIFKPIVDIAGNVVDKVVKDKNLAQQLKHDLSTAILTEATVALKAAESIIVAEAKGGWLQRNWRPITMLTFVFILFNNYVLVPYARAFGMDVPILDIPPGMWSLLTIGIGGYVVSRGVEKVQEIKARGPQSE